MSFLKTVVVVDDDPIYIQAFKNLLSTWEIPNPFLFFEDAKEALHFFRLKEASVLPEILLLDLNMPEINGWKFLERFAEIRPQPQKNILIYLVSSSIWEEDLKRANKNKLVTEFISKPILKQKLQEILS